MSHRDDSDSRIAEAGKRVVTVMDALDQPDVQDAYDTAAHAVFVFGAKLHEAGVPARDILNQTISCAVCAWWRGAID